LREEFRPSTNGGTEARPHAAPARVPAGTRKRAFSGPL